MDLTKIDKPFGELDDATKGALLLAAHRGEVIEGIGQRSSNWGICPVPAWYDYSIYRVQPKPVIGEVVMRGVGHVYHSLHPATTGDSPDYKLHVTFPTRDRQHVPGVYTSPDGLQIKIEVEE